MQRKGSEQGEQSLSTCLRSTVGRTGHLDLDHAVRAPRLTVTCAPLADGEGPAAASWQC